MGLLGFVLGRLMWLIIVSEGCVAWRGVEEGRQKKRGGWGGRSIEVTIANERACTFESCQPRPTKSLVVRSLSRRLTIS